LALFAFLVKYKIKAKKTRNKDKSAERKKRQDRAASPSERGRCSERASRTKARNAERMREDRAPSRQSSADAPPQAVINKTRFLARIRRPCSS